MTGVIGESEFLTKLQRILNEGLFVASYKYRLLLALAELSVEKEAAADGTLRIELGELAERFITLYWRQVAPFGGPGMLAQNTGRQAAVINKIAAFRTSAPTLAVARIRKEWPKLVCEVGRLLDMLAAVGHLERWVDRNDGQGKALIEVFNAARFPFDSDASSSVALWAYENAEKAGALLWVRRTGATARLTEGWKELFN